MPTSPSFLPFALPLLALSLAASACGGRAQGEPDPTSPPALQDASVPLWYQPPEDAGASGFGGPGPTPAPPVDHDPLAHCPSSTRDTFYVNVAGTVVSPWGSYSGGPETFTNLDANWVVEAPLDFVVHRVSGDYESLDVTTADGGPLAPGRYVLGSASAPGLALGLGFWDDPCTAASGTLDVLDSQLESEDGGAPLPSSALLAFDIQCGNDAGATVPIEGCVRYASWPSYDAGPPASTPADDGGVLAPCASGGYVFYVDGPDNSGDTTGPTSVSGAVGTWSAGIDFVPSPLLQLDTGLWPYFELAFGADTIAPGTYTLSGPEEVDPWIDVLANTRGCNPATGTVTIATLQTTSGANGAPGLDVTQLLMGFDLECSGSPMKGCVSFGMP